MDDKKIMSSFSGNPSDIADQTLSNKYVESMIEDGGLSDMDVTTAGREELCETKKIMVIDPVDTHTCAACELVFTKLEDYVQHKLSTDNCKVQYKKHNRSLIPHIVKRKNDIGTVPSQRKRKRKSSMIQPPQMSEVQSGRYSCETCGQSFGRSAALRNHLSREHNKKDSDEDEELPVPDSKGLQSEDPGIKVPTQNIQSDSMHKSAQCSVCKKLYKDQYILKAHIASVHTDNPDFKCDWEGCSFTFKTKGSLKRHMRRHTGERPYKCDKCGMDFAESGALTRHWKSRTPCTKKSSTSYPCYKRRHPLPEGVPVKEESTKTKPEEQSGEEVENEDQCDQPGEMVTYVFEQAIGAEESVDMDGSTINTNAESEHAVILNSLSICALCGMNFQDGITLQEHLFSHFGQGDFKCRVCDCNFSESFLLTEHVISAHSSVVSESDNTDITPQLTEYVGAGEAENDVTLLNQALQQVVILQMQLDAVGDAGTQLFFQCGSCTDFFRTKWQMRCHMSTVHGKVESRKSFACDICKKAFSTKDALTKHALSHSTARNYKCGECGKTFKRISHVREHLKVHSNERPYPCPLCGKSFKTANASKVHLRTHTSYMPYQCSICRKTFREKNSLERHTRTHTGEKPFTCKRCGRGFSEHGTLSRHMKAKVPCTMKPGIEKESPSLLAEFSSMVADTQQYLVDDKDQCVTLVGETANIYPENIVMVQDDGTVIQQVSAPTQNVQYVLMEQSDDGEMRLIMQDPPDPPQQLQEQPSVTDDVEYTIVTVEDDLQEVHTAEKSE